MFQSVVDRFIEFTVPLEGKASWMYCDTKRLVTVGIGCLIDSVEAAQNLPFRWRDTNKRATASEIAAEWKAIKAIGQTGDGNWSYKHYGNYAKLYLPDSDINRIAFDKLYSNARIILKYYPDFDKWPADAQMAVMQMAWWMGPNFPVGWPNLSRELNKQNFTYAADNCLVNGKPAPRNTLDRDLFLTAAKVKAIGALPSTLWYPKTPTVPVIKANLLVDGNWGKATSRAVQRIIGTTVDGDFGPVSKRALQVYLNKKNSAGLKVDGKFYIGGKATPTAKPLQSYIGAKPVDGIILKTNSPTVKLLQRKLNEGKF